MWTDEVCYCKACKVIKKEGLVRKMVMELPSRAGLMVALLSFEVEYRVMGNVLQVQTEILLS